MVSAGAAPPLEAPAEAYHGRCFGFETERDSCWEAPRLVTSCSAEARPGYNSLTASEYLDEPPTLQAKVRAAARLIRKSRHCVVFSGAGLSTGAGIGDYASHAAGSISSGTGSASHGPCAGDGAAAVAAQGQSQQLLSPLCAQPTLAHRVLVAMQRAGYLKRWINQNHDGLPQKAGLPQECINEIHGSWHAPDNPVIPMSGSLRDDLYEDLLECERSADLVIAVGTSLCGMNADRVVTSPAERAARGDEGSLGALIIGLQRTVYDAGATLRVFARCDEAFALLAKELCLDV